MADQTNAEVSDERVREALRWISEIATANFEQDDKLRSQGARTLKRIADKADDALDDLNRRSVTSQASEGAGWKLVPVEKLTPEMRAAAETAARKINPGRSEDHIKSVALDGLSIYRAIVAAAP